MTTSISNVVVYGRKIKILVMARCRPSAPHFVSQNKILDYDDIIAENHNTQLVGRQPPIPEQSSYHQLLLDLRV